MGEIFSFEKYEIGLAVLGLVMLLAAWIPQLFFKRHVTLPFLHLVSGFALFYFFDFKNLSPFIEENRWMWEKLTEIAVILSLLGAGLKIDRSFTFKNWKGTLLLLAITMPLTIFATVFLGWYIGLPIASAILLGAVLAPTDPVLAADVQVPPPDEDDAKDGNHVRFSLTSEAGLNDSLAFPFTYLAIGAAIYGFGGEDWIGSWFLVNVLYKIVVGCLLGFAIAHFLIKIIFKYPTEKPLAREGLGFIALSILFIAYGGTEVLGGYGFLAVFICALRIKKSVDQHEFHFTLYEFSENLERSGMALILFLLGGLATVLFPILTTESFLIAAATIFIIRPLAGWVGLTGCKRPKYERAIISFYGIRGIGSIYYLAYAMGKADFPEMEWIWATVVFIIFCSATVHGFTAMPVMRWLDRQKS